LVSDDIRALGMPQEPIRYEKDLHPHTLLSDNIKSKEDGIKGQNTEKFSRRLKSTDNPYEG